MSTLREQYERETGKKCDLVTDPELLQLSPVTQYCLWLEAEVARLKAVIAQHDLCHDLHGKVDARAFADGCTAEQRKIYGCAPDADAALRWKMDLDHANKVIEAGHQHCAERLARADAAEKRVAELERRLAVACKVEATDKVGFDEHFLDMEDQRDQALARVAELEGALRPFSCLHSAEKLQGRAEWICIDVEVANIIAARAVLARP